MSMPQIVDFVRTAQRLLFVPHINEKLRQRFPFQESWKGGEGKKQRDLILREQTCEWSAWRPGRGKEAIFRASSRKNSWLSSVSLKSKYWELGYEFISQESSHNLGKHTIRPFIWHRAARRRFALEPSNGNSRIGLPMEAPANWAR